MIAREGHVFDRSLLVHVRLDLDTIQSSLVVKSPGVVGVGAVDAHPALALVVAVVIVAAVLLGLGARQVRKQVAFAHRHASDLLHHAALLDGRDGVV